MANGDANDGITRGELFRIEREREKVALALVARLAAIQQRLVMQR